MRFCLVSEASVPEETNRLLREACEHRGISFDLVIGKVFDFDPSRKLCAGDLLYRAAVSVAATRAEQFLAGPGVATFYTRLESVFANVTTQTLLVEAAGVQIPPTVYLASSDTALLKAYVERLGGFPLILKVLGRSSGVGVMMVESMAGLKSTVDFVLAQGHNPLLCRFIVSAVHWRLIVLGGRVVASYRNAPVADDFRTVGSAKKVDYEVLPPANVADSAIRATAACGLEFAGVDVLEDPDGQAWFLEANFPTYYPQAQLYGDVDIAGAMVDHLVAKAAAQSATQSATSPRLSDFPSVFVIDNFADSAVCSYALQKAQDVEHAQNISTKHDQTGFSFEMLIRGDAVLEQLRTEIHRAVGTTNDFGLTFRFRRYEPGEMHPPHLDEYEMQGRILAATALLYLTDGVEGGETYFPKALPAPVKIAPKRGRLAIWHNYRQDGTPESASLHESLPVTQGVKATLAFFIYRKPEDWRAFLTGSALQGAPCRE